MANVGFCEEVGISFHSVKAALSDDAEEGPIPSSESDSVLNVRLPSTRLSNGVVFELWNMVGMCKCANQVISFIKVVSNFLDASVLNCKQRSVHSKVLQVVKRRQALSKLKSKGRLCNFLRQVSLSLYL